MKRCTVEIFIFFLIKRKAFSCPFPPHGSTKVLFKWSLAVVNVEMRWSMVNPTGGVYNYPHPTLLDLWIKFGPILSSNIYIQSCGRYHRFFSLISRIYLHSTLYISCICRGLEIVPWGFLKLGKLKWVFRCSKNVPYFLVKLNCLFDFIESCNKSTTVGGAIETLEEEGEIGIPLMKKKKRTYVHRHIVYPHSTWVRSPLIGKIQNLNILIIVLSSLLHLIAFLLCYL